MKVLMFSGAGVLVFSATALLGADATGPASGAENIPDWLRTSGVVAAIVGGPVFAMWYAWYMTTVRIPAIEKSYTEERKMSEERHANHYQSLTNNFREDQKAMWLIQREDSRALNASIDKLTEAIHEIKTPRV